MRLVITRKYQGELSPILLGSDFQRSLCYHIRSEKNLIHEYAPRAGHLITGGAREKVNQLEADFNVES